MSPRIELASHKSLLAISARVSKHSRCCLLSGRRELNSGLTNFFWKFPEKCPALSIESVVGVPRIELGSHAPEACILPLYYTPTTDSIPKRYYHRTMPRSDLDRTGPYRLRTGEPALKQSFIRDAPPQLAPHKNRAYSSGPDRTRTGDLLIANEAF